MRMDHIKKVSEELDNDPNYQFGSFDDMRQTIAYRAADKRIANRERQVAFNEKLGVTVTKPGKFWKAFKPGVKAIKPVNLSDT